MFNICSSKTELLPDKGLSSNNVPIVVWYELSVKLT